MPTRPLVSVIIPAYNAARFLRDAVASALGQTYDALEVVVVDDGSSDSTAALAEQLGTEDPRVRPLHQENAGPSAARNAGMAAARGELLCFLDADDVFLPDKLERQVEFLRFFPSCDLVYSDFYIGDEQLNPISLWSRSPPDVPLRELFSYCCWFAPFSPLVRTSAAAKVGGFDESLRSSEDWDFWIRAVEHARFGYLPGPVGVYRLHSAQMHHAGDRIRRTSERIIEKHHARGSGEWHIAQASMAWSYAKRQRVAGEYGSMAANLARLVWHVRSLRTLKHVFSLAGY